MNLEERKQAIYRLTDCSPLEASKIIQELELYDQENAQEVIDRITEEMKGSGGLTETVVKPVVYSLVDGILETTSFGKTARKKGLTASRVIQECESFNYDQGYEISDTNDINGWTEYRNIGEKTRRNFKIYGKRRKAYVRKKFNDPEKLKQYKKDKFKESNGRINVEDEYTGERNIYLDQNNSDGRRNTEKDKHAYRAEVDHIVPLKQIHEQLKGNYALTDADIKNIANLEKNYALTSAKINRGAGAKDKGGKFESTNTEFIEDQKQREKEGRPNLGLSEEAKQRMLQKEKEAQEAINNNADKAILANITGRGTGNTKKIWKKTTNDAMEQSKDYAVGNIILYIVKPIYFELKDIFCNGLKDGVGASSVFEALKIRFGRVKDYVLENTANFIGDNLWEFVKGVVSSLVEGFISLFVGVFKQIFKVAKEGVKILIQSGKVLFGENSKNMTTAEKGDAIIKILGSSAMAIVGIGVEFLLNKIGIGEPWSVILASLLSGIAGALLMYGLDQIDLFSVKSERRRNRICEIFEARINDTKAAAAHLDFVAIETLRRQRIGFENISNVIEVGVENDNIATINNGFYRMAEFFRVELPYSNSEEFCCYMESDVVLKL